MKCPTLFLALSLCVSAMPGFAQESSGMSDPQFDAWLQEFRDEARTKGISDATLLALNGLAPLPRVIELDNSQP